MQEPRPFLLPPVQTTTSAPPAHAPDQPPPRFRPGITEDSEDKVLIERKNRRGRGNSADSKGVFQNLIKMGQVLLPVV